MTSAIKKLKRRPRRKNLCHWKQTNLRQTWKCAEIKDSLLVTYDLDPWMMTGSWGKSSFTVELEKIIPGAFYKFRDINSITITATAAFSDDIRGQSRGRGDVLRATFSRANAESIVWDHVRLDNLPQIADKFWQHPRLITDDSK